MKKPAHRGATAGLSNAFLAGSTEILAQEPRSYQVKKLAARLGLSLAYAAVVAEQAYAVPETWESRA
jgi:hypothetical protein